MSETILETRFNEKWNSMSELEKSGGVAKERRKHEYYVIVKHAAAINSMKQLIAAAQYQLRALELHDRLDVMPYERNLSVRARDCDEEMQALHAAMCQLAGFELGIKTLTPNAE